MSFKNSLKFLIFCVVTAHACEHNPQKPLDFVRKFASSSSIDIGSVARADNAATKAIVINPLVIRGMIDKMVARNEIALQNITIDACAAHVAQSLEANNKSLTHTSFSFKKSHRSRSLSAQYTADGGARWLMDILVTIPGVIKQEKSIAPAAAAQHSEGEDDVVVDDEQDLFQFE